MKTLHNLHSGLVEKRKNVFLAVLSWPETEGVVSRACSFAKVSRRTMYYYRTNDPEFAKRWQEVQEFADLCTTALAESKLIENIKRGHMPAIKFWLENRCPEEWNRKIKVAYCMHCGSQTRWEEYQAWKTGKRYPALKSG